MAKLGDLILRVGADTSQLNKNLGEARKSIARNTREIQNLGRNLTIGVTAPLAIMGATSVQAFREQNKAIAQVEAGLKSTAGQVGFTSKELQKMATDLQNKTLFGDEVILKDATAQLLTFTNISGENFARTQQAALDLATRLDGDLKGASIQLGKALNDPVANLSALSRSGIQFSEDQKAVIKSLTETGKLAEAQTLILDELNKQYGGSAEAAAEADGGFTQLANSFGDLQEEIGRLLVQYLRPVVDALKNFVQFLQGTSDGTKTVALAIAGIAAAIGPLLIVLPQLATGLNIARGAMKKLNLAALANPYVALGAAIVGAISYLVSFTDKQNQARKAALDHRRELNKQAQAMRDAFGATQTQSIDDLRKNISLLQSEIDKFSVAKIMEGFSFDPSQAFGGIKLGKGAEILNPETKNQLRENLKTSFSILTSQAISQGLFGDEATAFIEQGMMKVAEKTISGYRDGLASKKNELDEALKNALAGEGGGGQAGKAPEAFVAEQRARMVARAYADELKETLKNEIADDDLNLNEAFFGKNDDALNIQFFDDFEEEIDDGTEAMIANFAKMKEAATNAMMKAAEVSNVFGNAFGAAVADVVSGEKTAGQALKGLAINAIRAVIQMAKANVIANATSPANAANLLSGGLATPAFIVAGLSMLEGFLGGISAFADGGIVSGPTLGLVGEYPGARTNPEVIAPLDKLRSMMGGQNVVVTGKISGRDILLTSERNAIDRNRVRGF